MHVARLCDATSFLAIVAAIPNVRPCVHSSLFVLSFSVMALWAQLAIAIVFVRHTAFVRSLSYVALPPPRPFCSCFPLAPPPSLSFPPSFSLLLPPSPRSPSPACCSATPSGGGLHVMRLATHPQLAAPTSLAVALVGRCVRAPLEQDLLMLGW